MKQCFKCNQLKELNQFYTHKGMTDGHLGKCKECAKLDRKVQYQKRDKEELRLAKRAYEALNKDKKKLYAARTNKKHPGPANARNALYRTTKSKATPPWLTKEHKQEIKELYILAKELSWLSESPLEVDHIMPLQGKNSSGLHVPWNLQILPKSLNVKKSNKVF